MVITKREEKHINEVSRPLRELEEKILGASDKELPQLLNTNLQWNTSKGNLLHWVKVLNKFDTILEQITTKFGLTEQWCKPQEMPQQDAVLVCAVLDFSHMLLENCMNRSIYASSHRLYDLLNCPNISIAIKVLSCYVILGRKFIHQRPNMFIGQRKVSEKIYGMGVFLPASTLTANTGSTDNLSLIDFIKEDPQAPKKWRSLEYVYYPNEVPKSPVQPNSIDSSPCIQRVRDVQSSSPRKKKLPTAKLARGEKVEILHIPEHDVRKLTLQQIFDKGTERVSEKFWLKFAYRATMAKAFNTNSYENIKLRQDLVILKCLSLAFLVMINRELEVTSRIFEADPTLLSCLIDLINLNNAVPNGVRLAAINCLECISAKKTWSSEIVRGLGGSVSHGLVFQNLRKMVKHLKETNTNFVSDEFNIVFFSLISNLVSNRSLAGSLVSAGLIQQLSEFINVKTKCKITTAAASNLLQVIVTSNSDNVAIFRDNDGFTKLISTLGSEVSYAFEEDMGGPPLLTIVNYSISYSQCNYIRNLLKFVLNILQKESGDTVRNLFDSALLKYINQIMRNVSVFGFTLLTTCINIVSSILHNEPTSYPILKETGTIEISIEQFASFVCPSSDLICAIPNLIGAIALNNDGLIKLKAADVITQFFKIFDSQEIAKVLVQNESYDFLAGAIDELSRHYPDFKPVIMSNLAQLVKKLAKGSTFELPMPRVYRSEKGSFYHSPDDEVIDNEDGCSQLDTWETVEQAYILESAASVVGGLVELGNSWLELNEQTEPEDWMKLIVLKNSPFDYLYSNAMYPVNGALKYFDDENREYAIQAMFMELQRQVENVSDYFHSSEKLSVFQALESDMDKADDLLNRLIGVNNVLFAFVDVFCNADSLSAVRTDQLSRFFGTKNGCDLLHKLGKLLYRVSYEEHAIRTSMPQSVAEETIIKEYDDGFPPTRIFDQDPKEKLKHDKTSAKFKNSCQIRLIGHRLHSSIAIVLNTLLMLSNTPSEDKTLNATRWMSVRIAEQISDVFVGLLSTDLFEVPDLFLILLYTMHYCFTDSHSDNVLTIPAIIFMQKGGLIKERETLRFFWSKVSGLDQTKMSETKELAYVKNTKESITVSIIMNCMVFFNKLTDNNGLMAVPNSSKFYESDFRGAASFQPHDLKGNLLVQTKILGFAVFHDLSGRDESDSTDDGKLPEDIVSEVMKLCKNIFSASEEKYLGHSDGSLYEISSSRVEDSPTKIEYLRELGLSEELATSAVSLGNGDLSFLEGYKKPNITINNSTLEGVLENFKTNHYPEYKPVFVQPQYCEYHTLVELHGLRESDKGHILDEILRFVQLHPQSARMVSEFLISTFLDAPGRSIEEFETGILRLVLDYIQSFDLISGNKKGLAGMFHLFNILILNDTVFFSCHATLEEFSVMLINELRPEFVNTDWFDDALFSLIKIVSGSQLPEPMSMGSARPLIGVFKEPPVPYKLEQGLGDRLFNFATAVPELTSSNSALAVCRLLTIYAADPRYADKVSNSGIIEKILKAFSYPKLKEDEKPYALQTAFVYLVRRCYETREVIQDLIIREIKQQYTKSKKELKGRARDLSTVLKDCYGVIMRDPESFVEEISKRVRFVDFSENSMKSFSTKLIETTDEDTDMPDADVSNDVESASYNSLQNHVGVVHLLLTELMSTVKNNWLIEPPMTEKEKEADKKRKSQQKETEMMKTPKSEITKNEHCAHIIFLLKVLTELLASYKQSKLEFLTFSKKQLFQTSESENLKPRSTSLNFLLHQLILAGRAELPEAELARKIFVGDLAVSSIIAFVSTVSGRDIKCDPKKVDPDLTFMRKFTIDTIHKVVRESVATAPGLKSMCERVTALCLSLRSLLSPNEESYLEANVIEYDAFHLANVVFESGLPGTLTSILSDLDLNYSDYIFPLESVVNVLSFLGQIKANHQELFRELHPNLEEEEVEEDENDLKEDTPDLFQNSTLGMYDVEDIDSENEYSNDELSFDEDDEELDDEDLERDIEIVYSEDDDLMESDEGQTVSSGGSSDFSSESDDSASHGMDTDSDDNEQYMGYNIAPDLEFDSADEDEEGDFSELEVELEGDEGDGFLSEDDHDHVFEMDDEDEESAQDRNGEHWMARGQELTLNDDSLVDFEVDMDDEDVEEEEDEEDDLTDDSDAITRAIQSGGRSFSDRGRIRHGRAHGSNVNRDFNDLLNIGNLNRHTHPSQLNQFYDYFVNALNRRSPGAIQIFGQGPRNGLDELKIMSTRDRWTDLALVLGSKMDGMRVYGHIFKKIYDPSRDIHDAKVKEEDERRKTEEKEAEKRRAQEETQKPSREEERDSEVGDAMVDEEPAQPVEPVWVTVGGRQVDIGGTDIDPEFFEALPDDMREDVLTQHIRERRTEASTSGAATREIDQDFLDALPENIRAEILTQEAISNRLRAVQDITVNGEPDEEEPGAANPELKENNAKQKVFFTPLIDRYGVASLVRFVFIPQSFPARKSLYTLYGQLCLNKQTRSEVLGLMIAILQDGVSSQDALERIFHQICARSKPPQPTSAQSGSAAAAVPKFGTPRTPSTPLVPKAIQGQNQFPIRASPFVVACQVLEALQFLLESDFQLKHYFLTEHDPIVLAKKSTSLKKPHLAKPSKYPLNGLLSLLDVPIVKQKSVLMDGLSRLVQITTRPLNAMKKAQDAIEEDKKIELPIITSSSLKNIVTILVSDDCSSRTFQQTLSAMQNLLVLKAHNVFSNELSKLATKLGGLMNKDLHLIVEELDRNGEDATDFDSEVMLKFTSSSSDQSKLLRVLTALDYLFGRGEKGEKKTDIENKELTKLYNNLKLGALWGALSEALDAFEANKNITHIATALLPLIESLMVVCKHSKVKEVQAKDALKYESQKWDFANESIENLFFSFTNEHKKILNQMVRSNPKLMSGPFTMLVKNPRILEFDNKKNYFDRKLHDEEIEKRTLQVSVRRKEVFLDSYRALFFKPRDEFRDAKLDINFKGEAGVDAGGVTREWYQVLSRQMFNPDYALFLPVASDKTTFHPNRTSWANPEHLSFFKFVGRIIGKAIFDNCFLDCHFSRDVYKSILGRQVSLKDLETIDLEYYKSLMWMLENDITDIIIETFSVEADDYGEAKIIDLVPNGRNISVTEENKQEYVRLVVEFRLQKSVAEQVDNFLQGFHEIIPKELISIFDEQELELLISGLPDIDVDDWKNNTNYVNYSGSSQEISYFWRAVRSFDTEERAKLLQFATGTSKVPLNGFKELEGASGATKFNIHKDFGSTDRLPSSHTCFNQIDLPAYDSYEKLRKALLLAVNEGHEGFGLA